MVEAGGSASASGPSFSVTDEVGNMQGGWGGWCLGDRYIMGPRCSVTDGVGAARSGSAGARSAVGAVKGEGGRGGRRREIGGGRRRFGRWRGGLRLEGRGVGWRSGDGRRE